MSTASSRDDLSLKGLAVLLSITGIFALIVALGAAPAQAGHNGAVVDTQSGACGETTFEATITDPAAGHVVGNMRLVVDVDGTAQNELIPVDGSAASITVGPFHTQTIETQIISWRVFGGDERDYDSPSWNGYGGTTFNADVGTYGTANGFGFVIAGTDEPNPFTNWNEISVQTCEITKDMCKKGGFADFGFKNQGQCIRFVNTGQDSR